MKMKALDSFYSNETKQVHKGDEFEVSDASGADLEERGMASSSGRSAKASTGPSENKGGDKRRPLPLTGDRVSSTTSPLTNPARASAPAAPVKVVRQGAAKKSAK